MQQVRQAGLAPAEPSGTDPPVAAHASQVEAQARQEKSKLNRLRPKSKGPIADKAARRPESGAPAVPKWWDNHLISLYKLNCSCHLWVDPTQ